MKITINVQGSAEVRAMLTAIGRQAPFAMSQTLNHVANVAQQATKDSLAGRFTLRRADFVRNTIYRQRGVDWATKAKLQAVIRVNPARDFLAQHEEGAQKVPISGTNVAIPLPAVREAAGGAVIPKRLRPSGLRLSPQVRKVVTPHGTFLVRNRPGKGKGRLDGWRTEFLYKLKRSVPVRPRLAMRATSEKAIDASFERLALVNIEQAIRTAR
jgi:hypothetical protein